jgi:hypothetical protein
MIRYFIHRNPIKYKKDELIIYHLFEIEIPEDAKTNENSIDSKIYYPNPQYGIFYTDKFLLKKIINLYTGDDVNTLYMYEINKLYQDELGMIDYFITYQRAIEQIPFHILQKYNMKNSVCDNFIGVFNEYDSITTNIKKHFSIILEKKKENILNIGVIQIKLR